MQDESVKVKVLYNDAEYELEEQELDRIVALASKKLRSEVISSRFGFGMPRIRNLTNSNMKVIKQGYESSFYDAVKEALLYAAETDMFENYRIAEINKASIKANWQQGLPKNNSEFQEISDLSPESQERLRTPLASIDTKHFNLFRAINRNNLINELSLLYFE